MPGKNYYEKYLHAILQKVDIAGTRTGTGTELELHRYKNYYDDIIIFLRKKYLHTAEKWTL